MTTVADVSAQTGLTGNFVQTLNEFIGQPRAKEQLNVLITAAKRRGRPLEHLMFASGYAGVGKTNLALICAAEMDAQMAIIDPLAKPGEVLQQIEILRPRSIVYMDEAHRGIAGGKNKLDWMLQPLENGAITTPLGIEALPPLTWIISTTDAGLLPEALVSRLTEVPLGRYEDDDADLISLGMAMKLLEHGKQPNPHWEDVRLIARAANNNPRLMRRLWNATFNFYWSNPEANFKDDHYVIEPVLRMWGVTEDGLTDLATRYLKIMFRSFADGAGERSISDALHEPSGVRRTEQLLHDKGLIRYARTGRMLTPTGRFRARDLIELEPKTLIVA